MDLEDPTISSHLDDAERLTHEELERIELNIEEERQVVTRRGLFVERETYQHLSDAGLLRPPALRTLLVEVDDQIEEARLDRRSGNALRRREPPRVDRLAQRLTVWLPEPAGKDPEEIAYAEASARRLAARRAAEALEELEGMPGIEEEAVEDAKKTFDRWEQEAIASLEELNRRVGHGGGELRRHQAEALARVASADKVRELAEVGLLPEVIAQRAAQAVTP